MNEPTGDDEVLLALGCSARVTKEKIRDYPLH